MSNPIKHSDLVEQGNPLADWTAGYEEMKRVALASMTAIEAKMKEMYAEIAKSATNTSDGQGNIKTLAKGITEQTAAYKKLAAELKTVTDLYEKMANVATKDNGKMMQSAAKVANEYKKSLNKEMLTGFSKVMKEITKETKEQTSAQKSLNDQRQKALAVIAKHEQNEKELRAALSMQATTLDELKAKNNALIAARNKVDFSTRQGKKEFEQLTYALKANNNELKKHDQSVGFFGRSVGNYATAIRNAWMGITAAMAGTYYAVKRWVMMNAELSDSMASVRRTTGMTQKEVYGLNEQLRGLNTRTAQTSLLDLAHVAGKLGIAKNEIFGFVKAADMIGVALGKDLGNNEEAINQLGRIVQIFKVADGGVGMEKALLKIGSALKDLGNASVAEETNIIDFTKRMGGLASVTGISIDKIMGLGATMDILGQTMEVSSTAINQIWIGMAQKTEKFAKIAGMSVQDFKVLMTKDFNEAFIAVAEGLQKSKGGVFELAEYFNGLGLDGRRLIGVMSVLSGNIDQFRAQMDIAKDSLDAGTTAADQFGIQNETLAAKIDKATKSFNNFLANSGILTLMTNSVDKMSASFDKMAISAQIVGMTFSGRLLDAFKLDVPTDEKGLNERKVKASTTGNESLRRGLLMEISLGEKVLEINKLKKQNQEAINKLKQEELQKDLAAGLLNSDGTKKTQAQINEEKRLAREQARLLKELQKQQEAYYQFLISLDRVSIDKMIAYEREKLIESGVWKRASTEEQAQWEYEIKKRYTDKEFKETLQRISGLMNVLRGVQGSKDFSGGKYNIPSGANGENAGLMQGGLPPEPGAINPTPNDVSGQLRGGLDQMYADAGGILNPKSWQDTLQEIQGYIQDFASAASQLLGSISMNYQVNMENELDVVDARYQHEYDQLDRMLANKSISEKRAAQKRTQLEKQQKADQLRIEKEYRKKQQDLAYIQAIINIAVGVTQALAGSPPPLNFLMAALVGIAGGIELSTIGSQKFAKGGSGEVNTKGTTLSGRRHSQGGIQIPGIGEAEDGEYFAIINRNSTAKYRNELPELFGAINEGRVSQLFDRRGMPSVNVSVNDKYGKDMLAEMRKPRPETRIYNEGNFTVHETGNYRFKTSKQ